MRLPVFLSHLKLIGFFQFAVEFFFIILFNYFKFLYICFPVIVLKNLNLSEWFCHFTLILSLMML